MDDDGSGLTPVRELVGVYNAEGTLGAELRYWVNARLGRGHCALCDITHGMFVEKDEWRTCRTSLPVPFKALHLDEQPPSLAAITAGSTPCVVARTDHATVLLLSSAELDRCEGSVTAFADEIAAAARRKGLDLEAEGTSPRR